MLIALNLTVLRALDLHYMAFTVLNSSFGKYRKIASGMPPQIKMFNTSENISSGHVNGRGRYMSPEEHLQCANCERDVGDWKLDRQDKSVFEA